MKITKTARKHLAGIVLTSGMLAFSATAHSAPKAPDTCSNNFPTAIAPTPTPDDSLTPGFVDVLFSTPGNVTLYCDNDPFGGGQGHINGSPSLVKWTPPNSFAEGVATGSYADDLVISDLGYNDSEIISGTWTWTHDPLELFPTIMVVKAGDGFFIQSVAGLLTGTFSTAFLNGKGISHLSFYDGAGGGGATPEVPLPAGILLLISALGGLGFLARVRKVGTVA